MNHKKGQYWSTQMFYIAIGYNINTFALWPFEENTFLRWFISDYITNNDLYFWFLAQVYV